MSQFSSSAIFSSSHFSSQPPTPILYDTEGNLKLGGSGLKSSTITCLLVIGLTSYLLWTSASSSTKWECSHQVHGRCSVMMNFFFSAYLPNHSAPSKASKSINFHQICHKIGQECKDLKTLSEQSSEAKVTGFILGQWHTDISISREWDPIRVLGKEPTCSQMGNYSIAVSHLH